MRAANGALDYSDTITIIKSNPARGWWWARGEKVSWLPVLVHIAVARASGLRELHDGDRFDAEITWRPKIALAWRLRAVSGAAARKF